MAASIRTVVVLPLVPVTASHCCPAGRSCQASSTSPVTGMPAAAAAASSGVPGRQPGVVITSSVPAGSSGTGLSATVTPRAARPAATRRLASSSRASTAVTSAPRAARARATGGPDTPSPLTHTRSPARRPGRSSRPASRGSASSWARTAYPGSQAT